MLTGFCKVHRAGMSTLNREVDSGVEKERCGGVNAGGGKDPTRDKVASYNVGSVDGGDKSGSRIDGREALDVVEIRVGPGGKDENAGMGEQVCGETIHVGRG